MCLSNDNEKTFAGYDEEESTSVTCVTDAQIEEVLDISDAFVEAVTIPALFVPATLAPSVFRR
jgi:hypothetical protein